jgi:SAM-dependent methyltransferase
VRVERIPVGPRIYELLVPADSDALLDDALVAARFAQDEYMPYWAALWPAAFLLADAVAAWGPVPADAEPPHVLELGCGLGLVGLVALNGGYRVTCSDYDEDALAFVQASARQNGLPTPTTRLLDWRQTYDDLRPDRILAADVLYEARNLEPVARFVARHLKPDGFALIADANRTTADPFGTVAQECGLRVAVTPAERPDAGSGRPMEGRIFTCSVAAG